MNGLCLGMAQGRGTSLEMSHLNSFEPTRSGHRPLIPGTCPGHALHICINSWNRLLTTVPRPITLSGKLFISYRSVKLWHSASLRLLFAAFVDGHQILLTFAWHCQCNWPDTMSMASFGRRWTAARRRCGSFIRRTSPATCSQMPVTRPFPLIIIQ